MYKYRPIDNEWTVTFVDGTIDKWGVATPSTAPSTPQNPSTARSGRAENSGNNNNTGTQSFATIHFSTLFNV